MTSALTTLVSFNYADGAFPASGLIADANGDLFGTTERGGANGYGTVFEIVKSGDGYASTPTTLVSFTSANGAYPYGSLITDANGELFGTTLQGGANGYGTLFEIVKTGDSYASTPTTLATFNVANGAYPYGSLIADANGDLIGTTLEGGANGYGTIFEIVKIGDSYASTPTTLVTFNATNGAYPYGSLIANAHGNLLGTTQQGGANGYGTVFEVVKTGSSCAGTLTTLISFNYANGAYPYGSLIADANGNLFGTTEQGGANGNGTVFEIVKTGSSYASSPTTLVSFTSANLGFPNGSLIADANGDLFGTTAYDANGYGTVFEIVKTGGSYASSPTTLVTFNVTNGAYPISGVIADANGNLFGTTDSGGANGYGTVFEIANSGFIVATPTVAADRTGVQVGATVTADAAHGVLSLDRDPIPGDTLSVSAVNGQSGNVGQAIAGTFGTLTLKADGSFTYTANGSAALPATGVGQDVFTYTASTGPGGTADSTLTVTVTAGGLHYVGGTPGITITSPGGHSPVLDGGAGNDTLVATHGATLMIGGPGDTLTGGKGADTYVFTEQFGLNTITSYNPNKDIIELDKTEFGNLALVQAAAHQVGANTVITYDTTDSITLVGVSMSHVHFDAGHFLLA